MEDQKPVKDVLWVASSKKDFMEMPQKVVSDIGYALYKAQTGELPSIAKPLKGFSGASVIELVEDYMGDTYRAVYTTRFEDVVVVLHAFQKKSKHKAETPKHDIELIRSRLRLAGEIYKTWKSRGGKTDDQE